MALSPEELLIVTNTRVRESSELARYYMMRRNAPYANLIQLSTSVQEVISRDDYEKEIAYPIREFLKSNDPDGKKFRCIVLFYGMPLRILPPEITQDGKDRLSFLRKQERDISEQIKALGEGDGPLLKALREKQSGMQRDILRTDNSLSGASVDSEIALVMEKDYPLQGWQLNRYFAGFLVREINEAPSRTMLVSRIDGPSEDISLRIINDALEAEGVGLRGKAYFDARWPEKKGKTLSSYEKYDQAIHNTAHMLEKSGKIAVVLDERQELFKPGSAPDAALYCGWYSLARYVDVFTWTKGAVGFHVASAECATLKKKTSSVWCKAMLEKGVAATLGPVAEPYLQSFPSPEIFFGCLVDGRLTLAECFALANPFWSWQMVLIGDPLYRPFMHRVLPL